MRKLPYLCARPAGAGGSAPIEPRVNLSMRKLIFALMALFLGLPVLFALHACSDSESYAEMKKKEKKAINAFIKDNDFVGPITVISEQTFYDQDSLTDTTKNEFVLFNEDGIYMQIVRKGSGQSVVEMAMEQEDSTVNFRVLCRFFEYDIENADTTYSNYYTPSIVDKMLCSYTHSSRTYTGSFTEGYMYTYYGSVVPEGWLKPFDFIRLTRQTGSIAKVRLIVPHSSGTTTAASYVLPCYYEITYQKGL